MASQPQLSVFPSTCWSEIVAAGRTDSEAGRSALGSLVQRYEGALTAYIRKKFHPRDKDIARDLFQRFVADLVVGKQILNQVRPIEGRQFRSFLLTTLHNFCISELRKEQAGHRLPPGGIESLQQVESTGAPLPSVGSVNFDLEWARGVLARAVRAMQEECMENDLEHIWRTFEARLLKPLLNGEPELSYSDLVDQLHFTSPVQAHNALVTAKRKFASSLRRVIGQYAVGDHSVDSELRDLQAILSAGSIS